MANEVNADESPCVNVQQNINAEHESSGTRTEAIEAIREGLAAAERGEMKPAEQVYAEMKARRRRAAR